MFLQGVKCAGGMGKTFEIGFEPHLRIFSMWERCHEDNYMIGSESACSKKQQPTTSQQKLRKWCTELLFMEKIESKHDRNWQMREIQTHLIHFFREFYPIEK